MFNVAVKLTLFLSMTGFAFPLVAPALFLIASLSDEVTHVGTEGNDIA